MKKQKKKSFFLTKLFFVFFALAVVGFVAGKYETAQELKNQERQQQIMAEKRAAEKKALLDYFNQNRAQIISDIQQEIDNKNFSQAVLISKKYLASKDQVLLALDASARASLEAAKKEARTQEILAQLKKIPEREYKKNKDLYAELTTLHPGNSGYKKRLAFYTEKFERNNNIQRQFSGWNGAHIQLQRHIKSIMNDPKSYDHVKTQYWDRGDHLVVETFFRGKNAFGGVVINSVKARVSVKDGTVLRILESSP